MSTKSKNWQTEPRVERVRGKRFWYKGTYGPVYGIFIDDHNTAFMLEMNCGKLILRRPGNAPHKIPLQSTDFLIDMPSEVGWALLGADEVSRVLHQSLQVPAKSDQTERN